MTLYSKTDGKRIKVSLRNVGTSAADIAAVTDPKLSVTVESLRIANVSGAVRTFDLYINDGTNNTYTHKTWSVGAAGAEMLEGLHIPLFSGDTLRIVASNADSFDVIAVLIQDQPNKPATNGGLNAMRTGQP